MSQTDARGYAAGEASLPRRTVVVVLGAHRSGTSALARVLGLVGCGLPTRIVPANRSNPSGHWEPGTVVALNDRLLAAVGSSWDGWSRVDAVWNADPDRSSIEEGRRALLQDFGNEAVLVLKDPRLCRLLPFWLRVFDAAAMEVVAILPLRHPAEVAASLQARNGIPPAIGRLIWLRHVLEAERSSRTLRRLHCRFDELLDDWGGLVARAERQLGLSFAPVSAETAASISEFLRPGLRHHVAVADRNPSRTGWVETVYGILGRWARNGEDPADHAVLDTLRGWFDAAEPVLGDLMAAVRSDGEVPVSGMRPPVDRDGEVAVLQDLLAEYERKLDCATRDNEWLRSVALAGLGPDRRGWRGVLARMGAGELSRRWWRRELERPGIFDPVAYLNANPDVAEARLDPLRHYLLHGLGEVRPRGPRTST